MKRHLMYRASFRAEWLQRFGVGSCNCVGFGCANGGMVFGEVGQAGGSEDVTLAAGTVRSSRRPRQPEPKDTKGRGAGRHPYSPLRRSPKRVCAVRRGSQDRCSQPPFFPTLLFSPWILKPFCVVGWLVFEMIAAFLNLFFFLIWGVIFLFF